MRRINLMRDSPPRATPPSANAAHANEWRDDCIAQAGRLEALRVRTRGELIVKETQLAIALDALATLHQRDARRQASKTASSECACTNAAPPENAAHGTRRVQCVGDRVSVDCLPELRRSLAPGRSRDPAARPCLTEPTSIES